MPIVRDECNAPLDAEELTTDWLPDPWGWHDLYVGTTPAPQSPSAPGSDSSTFLAPLVGGRVRTLPLLSTPTRTQWHRLAAKAAWRARTTLQPTVRGYRASGPHRILHYRPEYRELLSLQEDYAKRHPIVVTLDVESFFRNVPAELVWRETRAFLDPGGQDTLKELLAGFQSGLGYSLPEGYPASRALANLCLRSVDEAIQHSFTRWIDDYRVFVHTEDQASDAIEAFANALSPLGLRPAWDKVQVLTSEQLGGLKGASLADEHPHIIDPATELRYLLQCQQELPPAHVEARLRHVLRLCAERHDYTALEILQDFAPQTFPLAALPRLAWFLSATADSSRSRQLVRQFLRFEDEFSVWRRMRLGPALWYTGDADLVAEMASKCEHWPASLALLRATARMCPEALSSLVKQDSTTWDSERSEVLAMQEAAGEGPWQTLGPPMETFL